MTMYILNCHVC